MKGPQPSVDIGCGSSTDEDDYIYPGGPELMEKAKEIADKLGKPNVSFICTEALREKRHERSLPC